MGDDLALLGFGPEGWGRALLGAALTTVSVSVCAFAIGLGFGVLLAWAAIGGGFWSQVFWFGVIGLGILLPQLLGLVGSPAKAHQAARLALICSLSLVGILLLRYFILYAGQMTVM